MPHEADIQYNVLPCIPHCFHQLLMHHRDLFYLNFSDLDIKCGKDVFQTPLRVSLMKFQVGFHAMAQLEITV